MVFSSLTFLFALSAADAGWCISCPPLRWRNLVLLLVSLLFYGWGEPVYIVIMFLSIAIDYTHGMLVEKYRGQRQKGPVVRGPVGDLQPGCCWAFSSTGTFIAENLYLLTGIQIPQSVQLWGSRPASGHAAAHRHLLLHLPDHELHHRRLPQGRAGAAEHRGRSAPLSPCSPS